jgi:hypothetical protein
MKNLWIWILAGIIIIIGSIYLPVISSIASGNSINWKIAADPWSVKNDGYTYDGEGRLILDDNGTPMKGGVA